MAERASPDSSRKGVFRRLRGLVAVLVLLLSASAHFAGAADEGVTTTYGFSAFGKLKYPEGFTHFAYTNPNAPKGGTYRIASPGTFDSFNFFALTGNPFASVIYTFDALLVPSGDEDGAYYCMLCKSLSYPKDLTWVEFQLRPEARWHDGTPVTVDDIAFTLDMFAKYRHPVFGRASKIVTRVQITAPDRIRFYLGEGHNPALIPAVGQGYILQKKYWLHRDISAANLDIPMASGPYEIGNYSTGRWAELKRVKNWWGANLPVNKGRFNFDVIRTDFFRDAGVINEGFLAGNSDFRSDISATRWRYENRLSPFREGYIKRDRVKYDNAAALQVIWMNNRRPFFADRRVREAMNLGYDNEWMKRVLLQGPHGRLNSYFANTPFEARGLPDAGELHLLEPFRKQLPPELFTSPPEVVYGGDRTLQRANLLRATGLLRQAGYRVVNQKLIDPQGQPISLEIAIGNQVVERQVSLFMANLRRLGVAVNVKVYDSAQMRTVLNQHNFDFYIGFPFPILLGPAPSVDLLGTLGSTGANVPGSANVSGMANPAIDSLLKTALATSDSQVQIDAMRAVDRIMLWNHYGILTYHLYPSPVGTQPIAYWDRFGRPAQEPTRNFPILTLDHWWIDPAKDARVRQFTGND